MKTAVINTQAFSSHLRQRAIDLASKQVLITNFHGSAQERDSSSPANCGGFGRVHTFRRATGRGWPANPLPIDPALRALNLPHQDEIRVQVFQNAACNWRCWYCFVDFDLLSASPKHSAFVSPDRLVEEYCQLTNRPNVIDLSGGQPDLVPEWILWTLEAIERRGLSKDVFVWSDDNLSNDYFSRYLTLSQREYLATCRNYARVCCFKGFDSQSFAFNTRAHPDLFDEQFTVFRQLLAAGIDLYAYATLTGPPTKDVPGNVRQFVDRLQNIHPNLPLRTIPLEIRAFTPMHTRMERMPFGSEATQQAAVATWITEIASRFSPAERDGNICDVQLS